MNSLTDSAFDFYVSRAALKATILISLLTVWVLIGVFTYLNRYTKRRYFTIWTTAWLFYVTWLTLNFTLIKVPDNQLLLMFKQWCLGATAAFLLWGSMRFLGKRVRQLLFGLFLAFLFVWSYVGVYHLDHPLESQIPIYALIGLASITTAWAFVEYRKKRGYVGASLLALGFFCWGIYFAAYPLVERSDDLATTGFFISAILQLFIAVSMIVLVLEEVRSTNQLAFQQIRSCNLEKSVLRTKVTSTEKRYRNLFDQTNEAIIITAAGDLRILELNETAERLLGINRAEAGKLVLSSFCQFKDSDAQPSNNAEWFSRVCEQRQLNLVRKNGGTTTSEVDGTPIDFEGQEAYQFFFREMTDRARLEQQLRQAEKLSALGQMISGVAHELNNPLAVVKGYLDLILSRHELNPQTRSDLTKVTTECNRAIKLVRNFLAFARVQPAHREMIDLNELIERVAELRQFDLKKASVFLSLELTRDLPTTHADADQIQQLIINLINNAIQAMEKIPGQRVVKISTERKGLGLLVIKIEDNGTGVPPELEHRIFEPFFTTKEVGTGTGLGLSIAHSIMADHRGRIYYQTSSLGGAGFFLEFPIVAAPVAPEPVGPPQETPQTNALKGAQVLVLDDEKSIAELVCEMLSTSGHHPTLCLNPVAALELLDKREFDLIISDFRMPVMNGEEFYQRVLEKHPALAQGMIFLTGDVVTDETLKFLQSTNRPHLGKPFHLAALEEVVAEALSKKETKSV